MKQFFKSMIGSIVALLFILPFIIYTNSIDVRAVSPNDYPGCIYTDISGDGIVDGRDQQFMVEWLDAGVLPGYDLNDLDVDRSGFVDNTDKEIVDKCASNIDPGDVIVSGEPDSPDSGSPSEGNLSGGFNIAEIFTPAGRFSSAEDTGTLVSDIVLILTSIAGAIAIIFMIISGMKYLTSSGDEKKLASAQGTLTYAIIGLVVVILAFAIIRVVQFFIGSSVPIQ